VLKIPPNISEKKIINYFRKHNLNIIANYRFEKNVESSRVVNTLKNPKTFEPNLIDLYKIHNFILLNKRTSVLEFGCGWSSLVIEHAIRLNKKKFNREISKFIINRNFFKHYVVDNSAKYLRIAKKRNIKIFGNKDRISNFFFSECEITKFNSRYCTEYKKIPIFNPDFIYIDGPSQYGIKKKDYFTTAHIDLMPMICDVIKFENFLIPGTIIILDGRTSNARFLKNNFQRNWKYYFDYKNDQNIFYLNEKPLGSRSASMLKFYNN
jgi:hypothetical protein